MLTVTATILRGSAQADSQLSSFIPPNETGLLEVYDPTNQAYASEPFSTRASGTAIQQNIRSDLQNISGLPSSELSTLIQNVLGYTPTPAQLNELEGGVDPKTIGVLPTGIVSSVPLSGSATSITLVGSVSNSEHQTAYVATGSYGLAIVDVSNFQAPVVLGQLALGGTASDVAVDSTLHLAAVEIEHRPGVCERPGHVNRAAGMTEYPKLSCGEGAAEVERPAAYVHRAGIRPAARL
jgi:hypothetical protein